MHASTVVDNYATRNGDKCTKIARHDPVVWRPEYPGPLTAPDLVRYEDKGFHNIHDALSVSEIASCYNEISRLANSVDLQDDPRIVREKSSGEVRTIFDVHLLSEVVASIARRPDFLALARQILGTNAYIHQSRLNFKPGFTGGPFYWHSDFETWHAEDGMPTPRAVSISLALTPNYEVNGGLMILPGSHRTFVACAGETPSDYYKQSLVNDIPETGTPDHATLTSMADEFGIEQMVGPAGSATLFDSNCMHGSNGNITPYARSNLFIVFNSVDNSLEEPFSAPSSRPEFLAKHDFTALQPAF
ncbi:ectoine hydroxylase [Antrihabitans cavernicola]|uniref:Ectoine hydroxylase n=1 Tax=Antrihabitans cavernicola TaxID=2495913 RepID=A0A5A7SAQ0_9NOCA|nr:ectoine hydroxylase [Spelaeibacter cavernicola]KAA0021291.1 ectoine hydroxylase [Spelaeibacter cavernicola]